MTFPAFFVTLLATHPEVATLLIYVLVLAAHVGIGIALHAVRLHDFDPHKIGQFIEADVWTARGGVMLAAFLMTVATTTVPGSDIRAAFGPAFLTLVGSAGATIIPIFTDTLKELAQLITGNVPAPLPAPTKAAA